MKSITNRLSVGYLNIAYHALLKDVLSSVETVRRLDRAMAMLSTSQDYSIKAVSRQPLTFEVVSSNDTYTVIPSEKSCTCPDAALLCKHRLAVRLILDCIAAQKRDGWSIAETAIEASSTVKAPFQIVE